MPYFIVHTHQLHKSHTLNLFFKCPYHLLTKHMLTQHITNCPQLNDIFETIDPDLIANEITLNLISIIDVIAPLKRYI